MFGTTAGNSTLLINGVAAPLFELNDTAIHSLVPASTSPGTVTFQVVTENGSSNDFSIAVSGQPVITSVTPSQGPVGTFVTVLGTSFGASSAPPQIFLYLNAFGVITPTSWSDSSVTFVIPAGTNPLTTTITIINNGLVSNVEPFVVIPSPHVDAIQPSAAPIGTQVAISGSGFGASVQIHFVSIGGVNAQIDSWSDTQILATVPAGAQTGSAYVVVDDATLRDVSSNIVPFTVSMQSGPVVAVVSPTSAPINSVVTINGSGFGPPSAVGQVSFNGVNGTVESWDDGIVTVAVPAEAASGPVSVTTAAAQTSNGVTFSVLSSATSMVPRSGAISSLVSLAGSGFGETPGTVSFNGIQATVTSWNKTSISAIIPVGATSGDVTIVIGSQPTLSAGTFTITPGIDAVTPNSGATGDLVTLQGTNFGTQELNSVTFNGVSAQIITWSDSQIQAIVPSGASTGPIQLAAGGNSSNLVPFKISNGAPTSITLKPASISILSGETRNLVPIDNFGQPVSGAVLTSSDSAIIAISTDPNSPSSISGLGVGTATITGTFAGMSTQATVTVLPGQNYVDGSSVYSLAPDPDAFQPLDVVRTKVGPQPDPSGVGIGQTEMVLADQTLDDGISLRGSTLLGSQLWKLNFPSVFLEGLAADDSGGVVATTWDGISQGSVVHIDSTGTPTWYYTSTGELGAPAIANDGSIYVAEHFEVFGSDGDVVKIDGASGIPRIRIPLTSLVSNGEFGLGSISIMPNGSACFQVSSDPLQALPQEVAPQHLISLNLSCINTDGSVSTTLLNNRISGIGDFSFLITGEVIPDENDNILASWQLLDLSSGNPVHQNKISSVGSGIGDINLPLDTCADGGSTGTPMILGDSGIIVQCLNTIYSFQPGDNTPAWQWSSPATHQLNLVGAEVGGGAIVEDTVIGQGDTSVSQSIVHIDSTGTGVAENWSAPAESNLQHVGDGLFVNNIAATAASLIVNSPFNLAATAWREPASNDAHQKRAKKVEFLQDAECSAFDDTLSPQMILVRQNDSNTAKAKIHGKIDDVRFVSESPDIVTVTPAAATNQTTTITLTSVSTADATQQSPVLIDAVSASDHAFIYAKLSVVVKPRKPVHVDMFKLTDVAKNLIPQTVPSQPDLLAYLNTTWGNQANVVFTVESPVTLDTDYDLEPVHSDGVTKGDGAYNDTKPAGSPIDEELAVLTANSSRAGASSGDSTHLKAFYLNKFAKSVVCTKDCGVPDGESLSGEGVSIIQDQEPGLNSRVNVSAHELGHAMGRAGDYVGVPKENLKNLMYGQSDGTNPCRIKDLDWRQINPTKDDPPAKK